MHNIVNNSLIEAIKLHTPKNENAVDFLIRIIPMSKEAAYRRLRGSTLFTLSEASCISEKLNISIDRIAGLDKKNYYMFYIKQLLNEKPFEKYYDLLQSSLAWCKQMKDDPAATFYIACNTLPFIFYFKYPFLSQYVFFKWFYQISYSSGKTMRLEEVVIPQKVLDIQKEIFHTVQYIDVCAIVGDDIILSLINEANYFAAINRLGSKEITRLKQTLHSMLDDMENSTKDRLLKTGKKSLIYVSNAHFDANYGYVSATNFRSSMIFLFGINQLNCTDPVICNYQKLWIDALTAHSTLISGSGKLQRTIFFNQQREILNRI